MQTCACVLGSRLGGVLPKARGGLERPTAVRRGPKRVLDESQQSAPSRRLWASGLRDKRDFSLGRKMKPRLLINCTRRSRGRTARNRFLFSTDLSFLSHQKIPTILEWRPPWPLLRPLRRIWENGYHSLAWHPRAKLPPGP